MTSVIRVTADMAFETACCLVASKGLTMRVSDLRAKLIELYGGGAPSEARLKRWAVEQDWQNRLLSYFHKMQDQAARALAQQGFVDVATRGAELHYMAGAVQRLLETMLTGGTFVHNGTEIEVPPLELTGSVSDLKDVAKVLLDLSTHSQLLLGQPTDRKEVDVGESDSSNVLRRLNEAIRREQGQRGEPKRLN